MPIRPAAAGTRTVAGRSSWDMSSLQQGQPRWRPGRGFGPVADWWSACHRAGLDIPANLNSVIYTRAHGDCQPRTTARRRDRVPVRPQARGRDHLSSPTRRGPRIRWRGQLDGSPPLHQPPSGAVAAIPGPGLRDERLRGESNRSGHSVRAPMPQTMWGEVSAQGCDDQPRGASRCRCRTVRGPTRELAPDERHAPRVDGTVIGSLPDLHAAKYRRDDAALRLQTERRPASREVSGELPGEVDADVLLGLPGLLQSLQEPLSATEVGVPLDQS